MDASEMRGTVKRLIDRMHALDVEGWYSRMEVWRPWSRYNPLVKGELSCPQMIQNYLQREIATLLQKGAKIRVRPSRRAVSFDDPAFFPALNEQHMDPLAKKLFIIGPERMSLSFNRIVHYCGTSADKFQRYIVLTNYDMHVSAFRNYYPETEGPERDGVQMPAWHHRRPDGDGVSLINIGVGPSNAKTITDHLAALRPDAIVMLGHCGGLRNEQEEGDFVLATSYLRLDRILDDVLPPSIPVIPNYWLNAHLRDTLSQRGSRCRFGMVCTTDNRNWEFTQGDMLARMQDARCLAVDMESATVAANGSRYRIPTASLLCVSDKPLHASPKVPDVATEFYESTKRSHLETALACLKTVRKRHPVGLPHEDIAAECPRPSSACA